MYYIETLYKAICYIEEHLEDNLSLDDVANHIGYSAYHFDRIFKCYVGDSIKEYIRKRQMSEAAKLIATTDIKVVELAVKYHYNTREAFSRAFTKHYGKPPSAFRNGLYDYLIRDVMTYDYLMYQYQMIKDGPSYELVHLDEIKLFGKNYRIEIDSFKEIPLIWQTWLYDSIDSEVCYGLCIHRLKGLDYFIGSESIDSREVYLLKANDYVLFRVKGPIVESIQKTWQYIYSRWLIEFEYEHTGDPDIEKYIQTEEGVEVELYIPIKKVRRS